MKIQSKLFLILFSFSLILITALVLAMQWSIGKGMIDYVNTKELDSLAPLNIQLANEYKKNNNWDAIKNQHGKFRHLILQQLEGDGVARRPPPRPERFGERSKRRPDQLHQRPPNGRKPPPRQGLTPPDHDVHFALLDKTGALVAGKYDQPTNFNRRAITLNDITVGYLAVSKRNRLTQGYELDFIEKQQHYLWIVALIATALVLVLTLALTRHIVVPLKLIAQRIHQLTKGNYHVTEHGTKTDTAEKTSQNKAKLNRQDELGDLSRDCNELALTLSENEKTRKRWLADTSHELRTPVAILSGELEAMYHGIRALNKENILSAMDEVKHLTRLISDLHQLSSADIGGMQYRKVETDLASLLKSEASKYTTYLADHDITLTLSLIDKAVLVYLDETRFFQLLSNILENIIKYAQASQVNISLSVDNSQQQPCALISIADDGIGVKQEHLTNLFDFLYRVDDSRNREKGGSGLGLSICHRIVSGHQGSIQAEQSPLGGLAINIRLPML